MPPEKLSQQKPVDVSDHKDRISTWDLIKSLYIKNKIDKRGFDITTTAGWCAEHVNFKLFQLLLSKNPILKKDICETKYGLIGDAWTLNHNLKNAWWQQLYNVFPNSISEEIQDLTWEEIHWDWKWWQESSKIWRFTEKIVDRIQDNRIDQWLNRHPSTDIIIKTLTIRHQIEKYLKESRKTISMKSIASVLRVWDVVWLYYAASPSQLTAYRGCYSGTFNSHVWYVVWKDSDGMPIIAHATKPIVHNDRFDDLRSIPPIWEKKSSIARIVRPKPLVWK